MTNDLYERGLCCPNDLYPIVHDLTEVEFASSGCCTYPPSSAESISSTRGTFGCFGLQELAFPVVKPIPISATRQHKQLQQQQQQQQQQELQPQSPESPPHSPSPTTVVALKQPQEEDVTQRARSPSTSNRNRKSTKEGEVQPQSHTQSLSWSPRSTGTGSHRRVFSATSSCSESPKSTHSRRKSATSNFFSKITHRRSNSASSTVAIVDDAQTLGSTGIEVIDGASAHARREQQKPKFHNIYVLTRQIFRCRISSIWECVHRQSGIRYCVKIFDKRMLSYQEEMMMKNEVDMFRFIQEYCHSSHSNDGCCGQKQQRNDASASPSSLCTLVEAIEERNHVYIIMEYVPGRNLSSRLKAQQEEFGAGLSEDKVRKIALGMLKGLEKLQSRGILHGDLEPQNILLDPDDNVTIGDFGCSTHTTCTNNEEDKNNKHHGDRHNYNNDNIHQTSILRFASLTYTAPEIIKGLEYDTQADMWSLGVILYHCLSGKCPFAIPTKQEEEDMAVNNGLSHRPSASSRRKKSLQKICRADYSFPKQEWNGISRHAKQFISSLLHLDPCVRMNPEEAIQHKWLQPLLSSQSSSQPMFSGLFSSSSTAKSDKPQGQSPIKSGIRRARTMLTTRKRSTGTGGGAKKVPILFVNHNNSSNNNNNISCDKDNCDDRSISVSTFSSTFSSSRCSEHNHHHHHQHHHHLSKCPSLPENPTHDDDGIPHHVRRRTTQF